MKKLMDEEIIKALECCGKEYSCERCILNTWLNKKRDCIGTILGGALDLINRQKAEIERLQSRKLINADELFTKFAGHSDYHGDTILCIIQCMAERKTVDNARPLDTSKIKSKAYKEFAERLKGKALVPYGCLSVVCGCDIDNLLKEMAGE